MGRAASREEPVATNLKTATINGNVNGGSKPKDIVLSKEYLEFGVDQPCGPNDPCEDELIITNKKQIKIKYRIEAIPSTQCVMTFTPATGSIAPGKEKKIKIHLEMKEAVNLNFNVTVHVGNESLFLATKIRCATGVFGVDPMSLPLVEDGPHKIPEPLLLMKKSLIAHGGLQGEGIFRLAGEVANIQKQKAALNSKTFVDCDDVNTMATLIKVWFRELPQAIMQTLTPQVLFKASDPAVCVEAYHSLPDVSKALLSWLLDLLVATAEYQAVNKMTPQNLAIVVAPNLYDSSRADPMEGLVLSQKCVQLLGNLILWRAAELGSPACNPPERAPARPAGASVSQKSKSALKASSDGDASAVPPETMGPTLPPPENRNAQIQSDAVVAPVPPPLDPSILPPPMLPEAGPEAPTVEVGGIATPDSITANTGDA